MPLGFFVQNEDCKIYYQKEAGDNKKDDIIHITNEAKINFAPSRKKSDTTSSFSLGNRYCNNTIEGVSVKRNVLKRL